MTHDNCARAMSFAFGARAPQRWAAALAAAWFGLAATPTGAGHSPRAVSAGQGRTDPLRFEPECQGGAYRAFSFRAGSPISEPVAVAEDGTIALASVEGYLHALSADGRFLWSYTVDGALLRGVQLLGKDRFIAVSASRNVYALRGDGRPEWVQRSSVDAERVVTSTARGAVFFTRGSSLYALSSRAGLLWGVGLGARVTSIPLVDAGGAVWLITADGRLHRIETPYFHRNWSIEPGEGAALVAVVDERALVLTSGELRAMDEHGRVAWRMPHVLGASAGSQAAGAGRGDSLVASNQAGELRWLDPMSGRTLASAPMPEGARLVAAGGGRAYAYDGSGRLWALDEQGFRSSCRVGSGLLTSVYHAGTDQLVVAFGDGRLSGLRFAEAALPTTTIATGGVAP